MGCLVLPRANVIDGDLFLSGWRRDLTIGKGAARRNKRALQA